MMESKTTEHKNGSKSGKFLSTLAIMGHRGPFLRRHLVQLTPFHVQDLSHFCHQQSNHRNLLEQFVEGADIIILKLSKTPNTS